MSAIIDRLDEIEARANAATKGPWVYGGKNRINTPTIDVDEADWGGEDLSGYAIHAQQDTGAWRYADAEFMAHAREDVPWLIEQVRKRDAALQAVHQIAFDPDTESALEVGQIRNGPYIEGVSKDEALRYARDALRDIRDAIEEALS